MPSRPTGRPRIEGDGRALRSRTPRSRSRGDPTGSRAGRWGDSWRSRWRANSSPKGSGLEALVLFDPATPGGPTSARTGRLDRLVLCAVREDHLGVLELPADLDVDRFAALSGTTSSSRRLLGAERYVQATAVASPCARPRGTRSRAHSGPRSRPTSRRCRRPTNRRGRTAAMRSSSTQAERLAGPGRLVVAPRESPASYMHKGDHFSMPSRSTRSVAGARSRREVLDREGPPRGLGERMRATGGGLTRPHDRVPFPARSPPTIPSRLRGIPASSCSGVARRYRRSATPSRS